VPLLRDSEFTLRRKKMAGFTVVEAPMRTIWVPVGYVTTATPKTLYVGQLVTNTIATTSNGVMPFVQSGTPDTRVPFGVVIGTNNKEPVYDATYKAEYITSVNTQATLLARKWALAEGMWAKGDSQAMVQIAVIGPSTVLKGRIFAGAYGTAPTVGTCSAISTDGLSVTCGTAGLGLTRIAYNSTIYCRTGANAGLYRISYDTDTTLNATTLYIPFPYDTAVGDTFVSVNAAVGQTLLTFDALGTYINGQAAQSASNRVNMLELDLSVAGQESAIFSFETVGA
jgi:hypothetical protein